jgi:hypothetical protein
MKTAKVFKQGNSQAVQKAGRWQHVKACLGKFKGSFERNQPEGIDTRNWPR